MRPAAVVVVLSFALAHPGSLTAQSQPEPATHARSGMTREFVPSIYIPPLANVPFSAIVTTELTGTLDDGNTITTWNHRRIMRDGAGRIFQERASFVPKNSEREPQVTSVEISNPATHIRLVCEPQAKTCATRPYAGPASEVISASGQLPEGRGDRTVEDLGKDLVNGVEAAGSRETVVLNAGVAGNDHPLSIVREYWFSSRLGINLVEKRSDPRFGTQTFTVSGIVLQEPDPQFFTVPAGYRTPKMRSAQVSSSGSAPH